MAAARTAPDGRLFTGERNSEELPRLTIVRRLLYPLVEEAKEKAEPLVDKAKGTSGKDTS